MGFDPEDEMELVDTADGLGLPEPSSTEDPFVLIQVESYGEPTRFPRQAGARILKMRRDSPAEFKAWQDVRYKARTDQIFLGNTLMGLNLSEYPHRAFANFMVRKQPGVDIADLDTAVKKRMLLAPRGSAKTHFIRTEMAQWLLNYPNIRLIFLSGGENIAVPQLESLKKAFSHPTPAMVEYFPEYVYKAKSKWSKKRQQWEDILVGDSIGTQHHFTVPCRTNLTIPEASFTIATEEAISSGLHAEIIICDDLQNNANCKTVQALEKTHKSYLDVLPLLMPAGFLVCVGTRYSLKDVYAKIISVATNESRWKFFIRNAYSTTCTRCGRPDYFHDFTINLLEPPCAVPGFECVGFVSDGNKQCFCPTVLCKDGTQYGHTLQYLEMQKSEDEPFFWCQFMNDPQAASGEQIFTEALIGQQTFHDLNWLEQHCPRRLSRVFAAVDLAYTTTLRADNSVVYIFSVFQGQIFVWHCIFGKWNASTRIMTLTDTLIDHRFRPIRMMYIEDNLNSDSTNMLLETSCRDKGIAVFPVQFLAPNRQKDAKIIRIGDTEQILRARRLWLFSGMPGYDTLVKQLLAHPNQHQGHDDFADCLGIVCQCPTGFLSETAPLTPKSGGQGGGLTWLQKLNPSQEPEADDTRICGSY